VGMSGADVVRPVELTAIEQEVDKILQAVNAIEENLPGLLEALGRDDTDTVPSRWSQIGWTRSTPEHLGSIARGFQRLGIRSLAIGVTITSFADNWGRAPDGRPTTPETQQAGHSTIVRNQVPNNEQDS
jgi:hypothetical protein